MAHIRTDHPALIIQVRNKVQRGHAHVVIHRLIQKTAPADARKGFRLHLGRHGGSVGDGIALSGSRRRQRMVFRAGEKGVLPPQIVQEKLGLAGVGDGVEHVQRTENDQQQDCHGDHRRDDKFLLQRADHVGTSRV